MPKERAGEQRHVRVLGHPLRADSLPPEHHRSASGAVKSPAVFGVAGGIERRHPNCCEAVARHEGAQIAKVPAELVDMAPDPTPLLLLSPGTFNSDGAEGNYVIGSGPMSMKRGCRLSAEGFSSLRVISRNGAVCQ